MSEHQCEHCGREFASKSAKWKHINYNRCPELKSDSPDPEPEVRIEDHGAESEPASVGLSSDEEDYSPSGSAQSSDDLWSTWGAIEVEEATDSIPTPLKVIAKTSPTKSKKKRTAAEQKNMDAKAEAIVIMAAGGVDKVLSAYGSAVTMSDYEVRHSDGEKKMLASATVDYAKSRGTDLADVLTPGLVCATLWAGYVVPPVARINRNRKRALLKGGGRKILSFIPIFGRRFRRPKSTLVPEVEA